MNPIGTLLPGLAIAAIALPSGTLAADDCRAPVWFTERFVSADCEACWQATPPADRVPASGGTDGPELALDWIVPGHAGDDAPLALAALPEATQRAARDGAPGARETTVRREPIQRRRGLQITVEDGPAWNGYVGLRLAVEDLSGKALPAGSAGWLALVEEIPAGEDGTPVDRRLVRALVGPLSLATLRIGHPVEHLRAVRLPQTPRPERLRAVGWVETGAGRPIAALLRPAASCDGMAPAPAAPSLRSQR